MRYRVKLGTQLTDVISAMPGGMAEKFLKTMAVPKVCIKNEGQENETVSRPSRDAKPWTSDGEYEGTRVTVTFPRRPTAEELAENPKARPIEKRVVQLKVGVREGLFLMDDPSARKFSLGLEEGQDGEVVVRVPSRVASKRLNELACHTLMMVLRGTEWHDRKGKIHKSPCGDVTQKKKM